MMKEIFFASLLLVGLPCTSVAQSSDDLYFIPEKTKTDSRSETSVEKTSVVSEQSSSVVAYTAPAVVVRDVSGNLRDIDEYNRRYTSRDNTFSIQNDTLYIEEKPFNERGEWVNGFEGSQEDYEYAMRIIRFRNPAYAIPVSSPLYWEVVYGAYPSWDWNIYEDGVYAYIFPTSTNPLWWDWRWYWGVSRPWWYWSWWYSPWYYGWYSPYWYGGYWGYGYHHYAWGGWPRGYTDHRPGRYMTSAGVSARGMRSPSYTRRSSGDVAGSRGQSSVRRSSVGRVVQGSSGSRSNVQTVGSGRTAVRRDGTTNGTRAGSRSQSVYVRPSIGTDRSGSTYYNRPSSTRRSSNYGTQRSYNTNTRSSYQNSSSSGSFNRSSSGGGGGSVTRSSGGGGGRMR